MARFYVVKKGDTLARIAKAELGDAKLFQQIADLNGMRDPNALVVGQRLEITQADDRVMLVTVTDISDSTITLDANHPLAGKPLIFELELVGIV